MGNEIFPGNSFDAVTLIPFLEGIKKRFSLGRIIIVAVRLKSSSEQLLQEVFNPEGNIGIFVYGR